MPATPGLHWATVSSQELNLAETQVLKLASAASQGAQ